MRSNTCFIFAATSDRQRRTDARPELCLLDVLSRVVSSMMKRLTHLDHSIRRRIAGFDLPLQEYIGPALV